MASLAHAHKYTHAHSHTPVVTTFRYCQVSLGGQCKAQLRNTGLEAGALVHWVSEDLSYKVTFEQRQEEVRTSIL